MPVPPVFLLDLVGYFVMAGRLFRLSAACGNVVMQPLDSPLFRAIMRALFVLIYVRYSSLISEVSRCLLPLPAAGEENR